MPTLLSSGHNWLGKTKPKQAYRLTQNAFKQLLCNFKMFYLIVTDWLSNWLADAFRQEYLDNGKSNGLDFFTAWHHSNPRGAFDIPQYVQCILLCVPSSLLTMKTVDLVVACDGFLCITEIVCTGYFNYRGAFKQFFYLYVGLNTAGKVA